MDLPSTLVLILVGAAILGWVTSPRTGQALEAWAMGFIGYRGAGWPRGVQEEEPVHFDFSERPGLGAQEDGPLDAGRGPEIVDLPSAPDSDIRIQRIR